MYTIFQLQEHHIASYEDMTFTECRPTLHRLGRDEAVVAFGAALFGQPIGLILAERRWNGDMEIMTVFVKSKYRGIGAGTALLGALQQWSEAAGCASVNIGFIHDHPDSSAFARIAEKNGWNEPVTEMYIYKIDMDEHLAHDPDMDPPVFTTYKLHAGLRPFYWRDLTEEEKAYIRSGKNVWYPDFLDPFQQEHIVELSNSLGLRNEDGEIIGWVITHRIEANTVLYKSMYMKPEYRKYGYGPTLMAEAVNIQMYETDIGCIMFSVNVFNLPMKKVIDRFLKSYACYIKEKIRIRKLFGGDN